MSTFPHFGFAENALTQRKSLSLGLGDFGPFFIEQENRGLFKDLIEEVFKHLPQYQVSYRFGLSNFRLRHDLNTGAIDGAANIFSKDDIQGCVSEPFFRFTDVAVTLKRRQIKINTLQDLNRYSVVTYQGMTEFWQHLFQGGFQAARGYTEVPNMESQSKMLAAGRGDVSVGDIYIFLYSVNKWSSGYLSAANFDFHPIFPLNYTHMGFNDPQVCADFDAAFQKIRQSGDYERIYSEYLNQLYFEEGDMRVLETE